MSSPEASDAMYMREALHWAAWAGRQGEIPVAAVVVLDGKIVGVGTNNRESSCDPTGHAEVVAMRQACRRVSRWRLDGATIYVTLEPCPMCAGAIINSRIARLVYGVDDPKAGAVRSLYRICDDARLNHRPAVVPGVLAEASRALLQAFFRQARQRGARTPRLRGVQSDP